MERVNVFRGLARGHPEWLAQGLFLHALETEEGLRRLLIDRLGLDVPAARVPLLAEEPQADGWRSDVHVEWGPGVDTRFELELGAVTPRPGEAAPGEVDAVIGPAGVRAPSPGATAIAWDELAATVRDPVLSALFRQASVDESWSLETLDEPTAFREFAAWVDGPESPAPRTLHRFLSTLDLRLHELAGDRYRPERSWSGTPGGALPHQGFAYELRTGDRVARRFVGFAREGGLLDLRVAPPWAPEDPTARFCVYPLEAEPIARVLVALG